jgi:hypothetical protein
VVEKPFEPVPPPQLVVYDAEHPRPRDTVDAQRLREYLTIASDKQMAALLPKDASGLNEFRRIVGTALRVMINDQLPGPSEVEAKEIGDKGEGDGLIWRRYLLGRKGQGEQVPAVGMMGKEFDGTVVIWVHPEGKASLFKDGKLIPPARAILDRKAGILALDAFGTGELSLKANPAVNKNYAGYTFGYNRPLLAQRVHDILTAIAFARGHELTKTVHLVGFEQAGPWVLLARGLCGDKVSRTVADVHGFRFEKVTTTTDEMMLPGALKYGGLPALAALAAPGELFIHNLQGADDRWLSSAYQAAGAAEKVQRIGDRVWMQKVAEWLVK